MKNQPLKICNTIIQPGETASLALPMPEIFNYTPMYMPIKVLHGKSAGPSLLIIATVHGDELNGIEIINRFMQLSLLKKLKGTIMMVPIFNVYGFLTRSRYLDDGLELDQFFPGSKTGSHAARLTHTFISEIFSRADYCIDLRTGDTNHSNLPQIITDINNEKNLALSKAFSAPIIRNAQEKSGSLQKYAKENSFPYLQYEAGESQRFNEHAIRVGLKGIINVARTLEMISKSKRQPKKLKLEPSVIDRTTWVRAPKSGISYTKLSLGDQIKKNQELSIIKDPFGASENVKVFAPYGGTIIGKNNLPIVHEGEALFQIAYFEEHTQAVDQIEHWQDQNQTYVSEEILQRQP